MPFTNADGTPYTGPKDDPGSGIVPNAPAAGPTWTPNGFSSPSQSNVTYINGVPQTLTNAQGNNTFFEINGIPQPGNATASQISWAVGAPQGGTASSADWYTGPAQTSYTWTPTGF